MRKSKLGLTGLALLSLIGCGPKATIKMKDETMINIEQASPRYEVKRVAVFKDELAYNEKRGIYEILDKETGKTYFGISGIGITEVGSHNAGDTAVEDEQ